MRIDPWDMRLRRSPGPPAEVPGEIWRALAGQRAPAAIFVRRDGANGIGCVVCCPRQFIREARRCAPRLIGHDSLLCLTLMPGRAFALRPGVFASLEMCAALVDEVTMAVMWVDTDEQIVVARDRVPVDETARATVARARAGDAASGAHRNPQ